MRPLDPPIPLAELLLAIEAPIAAVPADLSIRRLAPLDTAQAGDLSFLNDPRYGAKARATRAQAVLVRQADAALLPAGCLALVVDDPYLAFARASQVLAARLEPAPPAVGCHPSAIVDPSAVLGENASIGAGVVIEAQARVGAGARIDPGCVIGRGSVIGARTRLFANVTVYHDCQIGSDGQIHSGTVIGSDGFGFARDGDAWRKIPQLGSVIIGDRVEIGANCCIDRGALEDTVIADDCILDNLIQIAHNVRIGRGSALAGCVGVAGSAVIGEKCLIGGGSGILGHIELADGVIVSPMTFVTRSLAQAGFYSGTFPVMENARWERAAAVIRQLPDMRSRLRQLEKLSREPT